MPSVLKTPVLNQVITVQPAPSWEGHKVIVTVQLNGGTMTVRPRQYAAGTAQVGSADGQAVSYVNSATGASSTADITASGIYEFSVDRRNLELKVTAINNAGGQPVIIYDQIEEGSTASAVGGGGGGASTIADGADVAGGAVGDAVYTDVTGAAAGTRNALLKGIIKLLGDSTAVALVKSWFQPSRQTIVFRFAQTPGTTAETMLTMNWSIDGGASSSGTSYAPANGKTLRLQSMEVHERTPSGNTGSAAAKVRIRQNNAGATTTASVEQESLIAVGTTIANTFITPAIHIFPEGREIYGDGTKSFGVSAEIPLRVVTTADPAVEGTITGFLYTT